MATREAIGIDKVEPYSKVIKAGGFIFVKSHIGYDYETGEYPPDIGGQTTNTLDHLERALQSAGSSIGAAVRVAVFLADIDRDFDGMNVAFRAYFDERGVVEQPSRTTIGVPLSWPQILVQMDLIAVG